MAIYSRVFCNSIKKFNLIDVQNYLNNKKGNAHIDDLNHAVKSIGIESKPIFNVSNDFSQFALVYDTYKPPILCIRILSTDDRFKDEINRMLDSIVNVHNLLGFAKNIDAVKKRLNQSNFMIMTQMPIISIEYFDDDAILANNTLLYYFYSKHKGLIQKDGHGFYDGSELILAIDEGNELILPIE